jgi:hypothetical protein
MHFISMDEKNLDDSNSNDLSIVVLSLSFKLYQIHYYYVNLSLCILSCKLLIHWGCKSSDTFRFCQTNPINTIIFEQLLRMR